MTEILIGGRSITTPATNIHRFSMILWGAAGTGKTVLAGTAPGPKLVVSFDHEGTASLADRDDVFVMDLATEPPSIVMKFKDDMLMPREIGKFLEENPEVQTVVVDSITSFGEMALDHGVVVARGTAKGKGATIEEPGRSGYGNKNTWTNLLTRNMLRVTGKLNRNLILICHEGTPNRNRDGQVVNITLMLGSNLAEQVPIPISEVWNLSDTGKERRIAFRPCRLRRPMKTKIFRTDGDPEFIWEYNQMLGPNHPENAAHTIEHWFNSWVENGGQKIDVPKPTKHAKPKQSKAKSSRS